ncbi:MAG: allophanate hydrolase subunit 1, partial [Alphaproteobacteria bacterium]|nr:allophanate hydrolase subunit 1 [Alphaproteobacteria bacterium]
GTTPIALFDALSSPPALFEPGDAVSFERIGRDDFAELQAAVERGDYQLPQERLVA